jgi:inner membrane protein
MDNLTHSMAGAVLGQMGLKRRTGLGMPALIIGANIPDIDATCTLLGTQALALRRGLTHGPIAMVLLPLALAGLIFAFDRWQARRGKRPSVRLPVRFAWLWLLAQIGTLSHPALDWLNNYGVRLLSPFSERWFYGDTLFIVDIWLWILLIGGYRWARRGEARADQSMTHRARAVFAVACAYVFTNGLITGVAEQQADAWLRSAGRAPDMVVANPQPLAPWRRHMLWRGEGMHGGFGYDLAGGIAAVPVDARGAPTGMDDPAVARAPHVDADARAFLIWSRMPLARRAENGDLVLSDQRFAGRAESGGFLVRVPAARLK